MATMEDLREFSKLSHKEKLDAAFNSGVTDINEANALIKAADDAAVTNDPQPDRGFFGNLKHTLDNLTPEQLAGLGAFGTQVSRGIQPGETLMSTLGAATQKGLATTQAARTAQAAKLAAEREEQLKIIEALRKQRETRVKEAGLKFREQELGLDRDRVDIARGRFGLDQQKHRLALGKDLREQQLFKERNDPLSLIREGVVGLDEVESGLPEFLETGDPSVLKFRPKKSLVNVGGEGGFKVPSGFMLREPGNPAAGVRPIPGGPQDTLTPEQAAKAQLVQGAMTNANTLDQLYFNEDGSVNRTNIAAGAANIPFSQGRTANVLLKDSIEAKLRAESGAAVPESEVIRASERFRPFVFDSDETIRTKRVLLQQFLEGTYDKFDPTGTFESSKTIDSLLKDLESKTKKDSNLRDRKMKRLEELRAKAGQ